MPENRLYYGDNLDVLRRHVDDESVDLVYLDPPFNSNADYNVLFAEKSGTQAAAQIKAFEDTWRWDEGAARAYQATVESGGVVSRAMQAFRTFLGESDMMAYLAMMAPRLIELRRVLKGTGSIYLHCDPTASHYLKMLMDAIFGPEQFRSEIIWRRTGAHNSSTRWGPIHDVILFYTISDDYTWNKPRQRYMLGHVREHFQESGDGYKTAYYGNVLTGSGIRGGESGKPWRGFDPTAKNRHWAIPRKLWEDSGIDPEGMSQHEKLDALYEAGYIMITEGHAWPIYEREVREDEGPAVGDIWAYQPYTEGTVFGSSEGIDADVSWIKPRAKERLGYPTQKPEGLLERIIEASSNEGDVVLDPFCGCGTTISVAQRLGRKWTGIDITHLAIALMKTRLRDAFGEEIEGTYEVIGEPVTVSGAEELAAADPYQFQWWALGLVGARPVEQKKGADKGIDGRIYFHDDGSGKTRQVILSVKAGKTGVAHVRDLRGVIEREGAEIGVLITMQEPTGPMRTEAASAGFYKSPWGQHARVQLLTVGELLEGKQIDRPRSRADATFKKAPRARVAEEEQGGLYTDEG